MVEEAELKNNTRQSKSRSATWQDVVKGLENDIIYGRLQPKEHLIEDTLMERYKVSRYAVRRALEELQSRGLAVRAEKRGTYIRAYEAREVIELYECREILEREAALRIPLPGKAEWLEALKDMQRSYDQYAIEQDLVRITAVNESFHKLMFKACPNELLRQQVANLALQTLPVRMRFFADPERRQRAQEDHWAMIAAAEEGDNSKLAEICAHHIRASRELYIRFSPEILQDGLPIRQ